MYEGWHVLFSRHARRRMTERLVEEREVLQAVASPDHVENDAAHGGKLLRRYFPDWDKILTVAVEERAAEGILVVKTILWSRARR